MSKDVIFVGWDRAVPGREKTGAALFQEYLQYLGGLKAAGSIDSFEVVLLTPHGGDLNGFFLIRGERSKLDDLVVSKEWFTFTTRSGQLLEGVGTIRGVCDEGVMEWFQIRCTLIPE